MEEIGTFTAFWESIIRGCLPAMRARPARHREASAEADGRGGRGKPLPQSPERTSLCCGISEKEVEHAREMSCRCLRF